MRERDLCKLTALESSVFPVPEGPVKSKDAIGRFAFPSPVRATWMAWVTALTASGWPTT